MFSRTFSGSPFVRSGVELYGRARVRLGDSSYAIIHLAGYTFEALVNNEVFRYLVFFFYNRKLFFSRLARGYSSARWATAKSAFTECG